MSKLKLKRIMTLACSGVTAGLFCFAAYLISLNVTYNIKETFFLLGLVLVLAGIVILISRTQNKANEIEASDNQDAEGESNEKLNLFLLGLNGFTVLLVGVLLLIVDAFL